MGRRDLQKEKEMQLAAVWGSEVEGDARYPKRRGGKKVVVMPSPDAEIPMDLEDVPSDAESNASEGFNNKKKKQSSKKARSAEYRLHCFVGPGTEKNAIRTVFESYEPKVDVRTSQKGSLLNKSQFAVLTFRNKAMALYAVKMLDGTNQRDLLGVSSLKLNLMLNRHQSRLARKKVNKQRKHDQNEAKLNEAAEDMHFITQFIHQYAAQK